MRPTRALATALQHSQHQSVPSCAHGQFGTQDGSIWRQGEGVSSAYVGVLSARRVGLRVAQLADVHVVGGRNVGGGAAGGRPGARQQGEA